MSITSRTASWTREEFLAHPPIPFNRDFKRHSAQLFRAEIAANDWAEFWTAVHESKGRLRGTGTSPFNVLWEIIKDDSAGSGGKRDVLFKMVEKALDCFERREADRVLTVKKRPLASYHAVNSPPDFTDEEVVEVDGKPKTAKASASAAVDEYEFE